MKILFTIFALLYSNINYAQEYYYNGDERVIVYPSPDAFIWFGSENRSKNLEFQFEKINHFSQKSFTILEGKEKGFSMKSSIEENLTDLSPAYKLNQADKFKMFPTKTVRVKMKSGKTQKDISPILSKYKLSGIDEKYGIIRIHLADIREVFGSI